MFQDILYYTVVSSTVLENDAPPDSGTSFEYYFYECLNLL